MIPIKAKEILREQAEMFYVNWNYPSAYWDLALLIKAVEEKYKVAYGEPKARQQIEHIKENLLPPEDC